MKRKMFSEEGGMEGIPLQLIIVVVVGMAALGILIGWLALAGDTDPTLRRVATEPETIKVEGEGRAVLEVDVLIYIYDSEGDEVDGAVVTFSGAVDEKVVEKVDSGDSVTVIAALPPGSDTGTIEIKAEKGGGMGSCSTTVIVMRD
jgi:hypothetical protein